jgi:hypothetical protein
MLSFINCFLKLRSVFFINSRVNVKSNDKLVFIFSCGFPQLNFVEIYSVEESFGTTRGLISFTVNLTTPSVTQIIRRQMAGRTMNDVLK